MVYGNRQLVPHLGPPGEDRPGGLDPQRRRLAQELQASVLLEGAGKQPRLGENLETVADADYRTSVGGEPGHGTHHGREPGNGPRAKVIAVGEPARNNHRVNVAQIVVGMPQQAASAPQPLHG